MLPNGPLVWAGSVIGASRHGVGFCSPGTTLLNDMSVAVQSWLRASYLSPVTSFIACTGARAPCERSE